MFRRIFSICSVVGLLIFSLFVSQINAQAALSQASPTATPSCVNPTFVGHVYDEVTGLGISGATVTAIINLPLSQTFLATTDANGAYSLFDPYGCQTQSLAAKAAGYTSLTKGVSFGNPNDFSLSRLATATPTRTATVTATPSAACVPPTPEALRVSPVTSPTSATTQVITVNLNKGSSITVTSEAGSFTSTTPGNGVFSVTITLLSNSTNHLRVQGTVNWSPNCPPYTLSTTLDTSGNPLTIVQGTGGSVTSTPTRTATPTVTPTPGGGSACSPVTATITAPFSHDGVGTFCWQSSNLGSYINSWNLSNLTVNGVNLTNMYVSAANLPAKINGYWYVSYTSSVAWGHFEAK